MLVLLAVGLVSASLLTVGALRAKQEPLPHDAEKDGRLYARPQRPNRELPPERGSRPLGFGGTRDGLLYVPRGYRADRPAPLVVMLHGSRSNASHALELWERWADEAGLLLLAPDSRDRTWELITEGKYKADVAFIDKALAYVFEHYAVDPKSIALVGFSDGASYALSLGLTNGDLFTHVVAFSPGFLDPAALRGTPALFISHGVKDPVLPIENCGRSISAQMRDEGYAVRYREFDGVHTVPTDVAREALEWFIPPAGR
ncbi:alpha/beta hydrolase [Vitiosangium sp. GDMCC 1.1324]|uniref:alpha/beta hydrolase n=1 Tax=Vitiosangium sp. (strain GDMCC 1.1324) TaxID=2138576 RepID=UPI001E38A7C1|nr:alpha/beta hydrolase-fold protein [Vitiosangium sp. GDMCC 1.1324]